MAKTVTVDNLASEIAQTIAAYTEDVSEAIEKEAKSTSDEVLREVRQLAPKRTGEYAKGFTNTKKKTSSGITYTVWNRKHYRRVHLLEYGWTSRSGKRVPGKPHMGPAEAKYVPRFVRRVEQIIRSGG